MEILALAQALGPIAGMLGGGGETNVSQSATNSTTVSLSSILSNQSPGNSSAPSSGTASGSSGSGAGSAPPTNSLGFPLMDLGTSPVPGAGAAINGNSGVDGPSIKLLAGIGAALAFVAFLVTKKRKGS